MNFLNNFKFDKILMMQSEESASKKTQIKQTLLKPLEKAKKAYERFNRSAITKNLNKTLENIEKIEKKTYEIIHPQDSTFKKFKSAFAKFSIKSPIKSIKEIRAGIKRQDQLQKETQITSSNAKISQTQKASREAEYQKIGSSLEDRKLNINFGVIRNELRTLKDNLNRELKDRERNNNLTESKRPEGWKHENVSDLKREIKKLNTQIKRMDKLERSAKIYNQKLDFKIQNEANKKPILERIKNKLAKIGSKITHPKQTAKSTGKFVLNSILHPQQTARGIKETIKQKMSGLDKNQYSTIETMKKDEKAVAQMNRLENKLRKYFDLDENARRGNVACYAAIIINNKLKEYGIDNINKSAQDNLKLYKDAIKEVKQDLDKFIHGKHDSTLSKTMHKEVLKEVQNFERSMEKAGKDIGSSHGF